MRVTTLICCALLSLTVAARGQITNLVDSTNIVYKPMSLEDAMRLAMENNFSIARLRFEPQIAEFRASSTWSYYEPTFNVRAEHTYRERESGGFSQFTGAALPSSTTDADIQSAGLSGVLLPSGLRYNLNGNVSHDTGRSLNRTIDTYSADTGISLEQPLLRDFWIDSGRLNMQVARKDLRISEYRFQREVMSVIYQVQRTYYNLMAALDEVKSSQKSLELAQRLVDENRQKVRVGTMAPLDEKQAESEAAGRQADLIQARLRAELLDNELKNLVSRDYQEWYTASVAPTDALVAVPQPQDLQESWVRALNMRPDYNQVKEEAERQGLIVGYRFNQLFPALDLIGTYGRAGFDTRGTNPFSGTLVDSSFSRTMEDLRDETNPRFSYGVVLSTPLTFRAERNAYKEAKASKKQLELQVRETHQQVLVEVENAVRSVQGAYERVQATRAAREFAQIALDAEQKKLENGKSTSFFVLQFQRDLTEARSAEIRALAEYNISLAAVAFAEGSTLDRNRIKVTFK